MVDTLGDAFGRLEDNLHSLFSGARVVFGDREAVLGEVDLRNAFQKGITDDGDQVLVRTAEIVVSHATVLLKEAAPKGKFVSDSFARLVGTLYSAAQELKRLARDITSCKKSHAKQAAKLDENQSQLGSRDETGKEVTQKSLDAQRDRLAERQDRLAQLASEFDAHAIHGILKQFATLRSSSSWVYEHHGHTLVASTILKWSESKNRMNGRPPVLSVEGEEALYEHVSQALRRGFFFTWREVCGRAGQIRRDGGPVPSRRWYTGWLKRMQKLHPDLMHKGCAGISSSCVQHYCTQNINWWYTVTSEELIEIGVARKATEIEARDGHEVIWLHPGRVLLLDECHVGGKRDKQSTRSKAKGPVLGDLIAQGQQFRSLMQKEDEQHVTVLAGMNLIGDCAPPAWVLCGKKMSANQKKNMDAICKEWCTSAKLQPIDQREYDQVNYFVSQSGSVTKDNFLEIVMAVVKTAYPDVSNASPATRS